ncbi:Aste57867_25289 [Aphanomyces stellatus]|uniref:Aste57867_25289 protein n=1 Tax=Aphanomyces stellatus TaxID=120398 RepID=A0A485LSS2_9STRA|nr:hypothetical protein As57867_025211 [Aphanomyces stellatus]VFU01914.1 Aste57867_25289 [Aphanomyces stellatus]
MKRSLEHTRSAPVLPPAVTNGFAVGSPLHAALDKMLSRDDKVHKQQAQHNQPKAAFLTEDNHHTRKSTETYEPESTELFAYTNALLHRVTGRYLPVSVVGDGESQAAEVAHIQTDRELLLAVQSVQAISHQFHDAAQLVLAHRKELGKLLLKLESTYLGVFEKLLEAALRFYYKYRAEHTAERHEQRKNTLALRTKVAELEDTIRVLTHHVEAKESLTKSQKIQLRDLEFQNQSLRESEATFLAMQDEYRELKMYRLDYDKREAMLKKREEQLWKHQDQMDIRARMLEHHHKSEQARLVDEARVLKEHMEKKLAQVQERAEEDRLMFEGNAMDLVDAARLRPPPPTCAAATQTEVDDDGLWDLQDGMPACVSKGTAARLHWRRFNAFVRCKNCRGRPPKPTDIDKAYAEVWNVKTMRKRWRVTVQSEWTVPHAINSFLTHLPRSAMAFKYYTLSSVVERIESIYDAKLLADCSDDADGIGCEELNQFASGFFLKTCTGRQKAEVELYRLLISVKALYKGSSMLRMFARFMHLLQPMDKTQQDDTTTIKPDVKESNLHVDDDETKANMSKTELNQRGVTKQSYLNQSYLRVYLHARHRALYNPATDHDYPSSCHVICLDGVKKWIPLDRGVNLLKWYLSYLAEDRLRAYCRQLEYNSAIYAGGVVSDPAGQRLTVRAHMRASMLQAAAAKNNGDGVDGSASMEKPEPSPEKRHEAIVVVNVYLVLELIMDVLQLRNKEIEDELIALFHAGDVNHDQGLSFNEFAALLQPRVPHFNERRILRMFREAVTLGHDETFKISIQTFVDVCTHHGLVSLVAPEKLPSLYEVGAHQPRGLMQAESSPIKKKKHKSHYQPSSSLAAIVEQAPTDSTKDSQPPSTHRRRHTNNGPSSTTEHDSSSTTKWPSRRNTATLPPENILPSASATSTTPHGAPRLDSPAHLMADKHARTAATTKSQKKKKTLDDASLDEIEEHIVPSPRSQLLDVSRDDDVEEIQEEINMMLDFV